MGSLLVGGAINNMLDLDGSKAAGAAQQSQREAADRASAVQKEMFETQRKDLAPWTLAGSTALGGLANKDFQRDFTQADFQADPGYAFRMQEGQKAIERSAAARGGLNSGATLKSLTNYSQGAASSEFQNAYNRFNSDRDRRFGRLQSVANMGQSAAAGQASAAGNYGQSMANIHTGLGQAQADAEMGKAQQKNQLIGQAIGGAALAFSDERLKTNISPVSHEDLAELKSSIKPYMFSYINEKHGEGEWLGVMAQDLEKTKLGKTLVVEDANGNKQIDLKKALSLLLVTFSEVA